MLNTHITTNKLPSIWRQSMILAILKPGKDSIIPKNYRPISLLCHTYTLYARIVLHWMVPFAERHLIMEQMGFWPTQSYTSLHLIQHIDNGYQRRMITYLNLSNYYMWNWTKSAADSESRKIAYPMVVFYPILCSTSTQKQSITSLRIT